MKVAKREAFKDQSDAVADSWRGWGRGSSRKARYVPKKFWVFLTTL